MLTKRPGAEKIAEVLTKEMNRKFSELEQLKTAVNTLGEKVLKLEPESSVQALQEVKQVEKDLDKFEVRLRDINAAVKEVLPHSKKVDEISSDINNLKEQLTAINVRFGEIEVPELENVEAAGLSYEEAQEIIKTEILMRRMLFWKVQSKAKSEITPSTVIKAYEEYVNDAKREKKYTFQIISLRSKDLEKATQLAEKLKKDIDNGVSPAALESIEGVYLSVSEQFCQKSRELSQSALEALEKATKDVSRTK